MATVFAGWWDGCGTAFVKGFFYFNDQRVILNGLKPGAWYRKKTTGHIFGPGLIIYAFSECHFLTHSVFKDLLVFSTERPRTRGWNCIWSIGRLLGRWKISLLIVDSDFGLGQEQTFQIFEVFWHVVPWDICVFISDIANKDSDKFFKTDSTLRLN